MTDSDDVKKRIQAACEKYSKKELPKPKRTTNLSPERDIQKQVVKHLNAQGWNVNVVEAKSTYSQKLGRYISQSVMPGFSDISGNDPEGRAVFIEMKAPGKRNTMRASQEKFLLSKIHSNCFAIVADSIEYVEHTYVAWLKSLDRKRFLVDELPVLKLNDTDDDLLF